MDVNVSLTAVENMWKITDFAQQSSSSTEQEPLSDDDDTLNDFVKTAAAITLDRLRRLAFDYR